MLPGTGYRTLPFGSEDKDGNLSSPGKTPAVAVVGSDEINDRNRDTISGATLGAILDYKLLNTQNEYIPKNTQRPIPPKQDQLKELSQCKEMLKTAGNGDKLTRYAKHELENMETFVANYGVVKGPESEQSGQAKTSAAK